MCGIYGYAGWDADDALLDRMSRVSTHRGPDDHGALKRPGAGIGMSRLSIIDVAGGHQPIFNEDGSLAIVFNGEIYNHRELGESLRQKGHRFQTRTDTESILHLYEEEGPDCLRRLRGMFGLAIYDLRQERMFIARDRMGIKPLYYWSKGGRLVFASEIKAILECPEVSRQPHLPSVDAFMSLRYVPGPETMFEGILKLPPGHWMMWEKGTLRIQRYWTPTFTTGPSWSDQEYQERFDALLTESVKMHLMSEVPLGCFLSGGVDSTALAATMSRLVSTPVKTFSIGFDWEGDELPEARAAARALGCDHHEIICKTEDFAHLPKLIWHLDEPVGDGIILPIYLLSKEARRHVTVILTGEGADETLAGYLPHKVMYWVRRYVRGVPRALRRHVVEALIARLPASLLTKAFHYPAALGERGRRKFLDYLELADRRSFQEEYHFLLSLFDDRDKDKLYASGLAASRGQWPGRVEQIPPGSGKTSLDEILRLGYAHWLPDVILMKQDKLTMANSIEGRVPFLDHVLVEFLLSAPSRLKLSGFREKVLLRNYLKRALPGGAARRKKKPFYIPLDKYLNAKPLKEMVDECLSEESVKRRGYFDWESVRELRRSVDQREFLYAKQVFSLLTLELWHRIFIDREPGWVA